MPWVWTQYLRDENAVVLSDLHSINLALLLICSFQEYCFIIRLVFIGPESPTLDAWKSNSDQILLQDPYPTQAYNSDPADAKSRFLNQTYFKRNADPRLPINRVHSASNLMEGLAEFSSSKTPPIASPLKRHQFQKSATESLLIVDEKKTATKKLNDDGNKTRTVRTVTPTRDQEKEEREKHEERLVDDSEHGKWSTCLSINIQVNQNMFVPWYFR